jgi:hypothetical protein
MKFSKRIGFGVVLLLLASGALLAQDIPLNNWTVPPYTHSSGGITTMTDVTSPRLFVGITPCRVADTRGNGAPIQGGIFANSEQRDWTVWGICGIPSGADAISVNFSVVSAPATPQGAFLLAWPTGSPPVFTTAIMTYGPGVTIISNAAIVPLNGSGQMTVNVSHSTHIIMDVNGYFSDTLQSPQNFLTLTNNSGLWTALFENQSTSCGGACGVLAQVNSGFAVVGASSESNADVNVGVSGSVASTGGGSAGVRGVANSASGFTFGVKGSTNSSGFDAAGVKGSDGTGDPLGDTLDCGPCQESGVRGMHGLASFGYGVLGISRNGAGVAGFALNDTTTTSAAEGYLGTDFGVDPGGGGSIWAVFGRGDIGASGTKFFVEPHPTDASKVIRYISLEGAEAGTYFRGKGKFQNGIARIEVPEDFRLVTDSEGLSIQITPIGDMATVAVQSIGLEQIVVKGSRNVEFFYTVNGVRATFKDNHPIVAGREFAPQKENETMPEYLSAGQKQLLIQNGTYRPDGTINMETAHRLGWDQRWIQDRAVPTPQPVSGTP